MPSIKWLKTGKDSMFINCSTMNTQTHNCFTALLEYVRDHPGEHVPER